MTTTGVIPHVHQTHVSPALKTSPTKPRAANTINNNHHTVPRLPGVVSAVSFATSSTSSLRPPSKTPWKPDKLEPLGGRGEAGSHHHGGGGGGGAKGPGDAAGGSEKKKGKGKKSMATHHPLWTRYVRTSARPGDFKWKGSKHDQEEDDGKYVFKVSLPCPAHSECGFCVYSRHQLGPVKLYYSQTTQRQPAKATRKKLKLDRRRAEVFAPQLAGLKFDKTKLVFLKERWLRCSAPSGEVIVPDPAPPRPVTPRPGYHDKCRAASLCPQHDKTRSTLSHTELKSREVLGVGRRAQHGTYFNLNNVIGDQTRMGSESVPGVRGPDWGGGTQDSTSSSSALRAKDWSLVRTAAPPAHSYRLAPLNTLRTTRAVRSVSFHDDVNLLRKPVVES